MNVKISMSALETATKQPVSQPVSQPVNTVNQTVSQPSQQPYKAHEVSISLFDTDIEPWRMERITTWASNYNYEIVQTLLEAIQARNEGHRKLSAREADSAARSRLNLYPDSPVDIFLLGGSCIVEGIVGVENSTWELRRKYNTGLAWLRNRPQQPADPAKERSLLATVQAKMNTFLLQLHNSGLPAWPEETEVGFASSLLRPEWMTDQQYDIQSASRRHVK